MDWLERMNKAMDYIETHLTEDIDYNQVAKFACCSTYHFQRMFSFITDVSLSEYIRRRRLTLAAFELQNSKVKVIDTAIKYGYESSEAFSRAFKKMHGIMPVSVHNMGVNLKAYPRMSFHISIKGDHEMNYSIEKKEAFQMFGVYGLISTEREKAFVEVPEFCVKCDNDGTVDKMNSFIGRSSDSMLHAALFDYTDETFKYMICYYAKDSVEIPKQYEKLFVPELTWAIFQTEGMVQETWKRIYSEWFPTSNYEQVFGPTFEMYYGIATDNTSEIWIPVKKK